MADIPFPWHERRTIRLSGYDYGQPGAYFVTVCTYQRVCVFGEVAGDVMHRNALGEIVYEEWLRTAVVRSNVTVGPGDIVVMPNHVHGIITIAGRGRPHDDDPWRGPDLRRDAGVPHQTGPRGPAPGSIGAIVGQLKSVTTRRVNAFRGTPGGRLWQRNYYEHVVRDRAALARIRLYIADNPVRWADDPDNLSRMRP